MDEVGRRYQALALRIGRHLPEYVDFWLGDPLLREVIAAEEPAPPIELHVEAVSLHEAAAGLPADDVTDGAAPRLAAGPARRHERHHSLAGRRGDRLRRPGRGAVRHAGHRNAGRRCAARPRPARRGAAARPVAARPPGGPRRRDPRGAGNLLAAVAFMAAAAPRADAAGHGPAGRRVDRAGGGARSAVGRIGSVPRRAAARGSSSTWSCRLRSAAVDVPGGARGLSGPPCRAGDQGGRAVAGAGPGGGGGGLHLHAGDRHQRRAGRVARGVVVGDQELGPGCASSLASWRWRSQRRRRTRGGGRARPGAAARPHRRCRLPAAPARLPEAEVRAMLAEQALRTDARIDHDLRWIGDPLRAAYTFSYAAGRRSSCRGWRARARPPASRACCVSSCRPGSCAPSWGSLERSTRVRSSRTDGCSARRRAAGRRGRGVRALRAHAAATRLHRHDPARQRRGDAALQPSAALQGAAARGPAHRADPGGADELVRAARRGADPLHRSRWAGPGRANRDPCRRFPARVRPAAAGHRGGAAPSVAARRASRSACCARCRTRSRCGRRRWPGRRRW